MSTMNSMKKLMENKLALLGIGAVVIVFAIAGFMFFQNSNRPSEIVEEDTIEEQAIEIDPDDIGLTLTPNSNNTEVTMEISDTSSFSSFEYEMSYDAEVDGEIVPRGAIGSGEVESGEPIKREITIGTCSSGKCKYDTGVTKISFIIRLNLNDGQTGIVKKDLDLGN
jgi:hypothetical protein